MAAADMGSADMAGADATPPPDMVVDMRPPFERPAGPANDGIDAFAHACVTMGSIGIGILVPAGPGYFGAFQFSAFMALAMFFPESVLTTKGAVFVFLLYVCQVGWHLLGALVGISISPSTTPPRENLAGDAGPT